MPDYSSLLSTLGYDYPSLEALFIGRKGRYEPEWGADIAPLFERGREALGELPGLRGGMLSQLASGIQQRGITAGRELRGRRAGAGFAGFGALDRLGRTTRRGLGEEYGRGMWRIGEDIAGKRGGILGTLFSDVESYLRGIERDGDGGPPEPRPPEPPPVIEPDEPTGEWPEPRPDTGEPVSYEQWLANQGLTWARYSSMIQSSPGMEDEFRADYRDYLADFR